MLRLKELRISYSYNSISPNKFKRAYNSVMIVPTGIGAAIGGFAGDALPVARALASVVDCLISHPNATKKHLSSIIDRVDCNLDECAELTAATREEVSELPGEMKTVGVDVQSVHHAVRTLETKISRIEGKQDLTNEGVRRLVDYSWNLGNGKIIEQIEAAPSSSSRPTGY